MQLKAMICDDAADVIHVQTIDDDGKTIKKVISVSDFLSLFDDCQVIENEYREIGKLPHGYYKGAIHPTREQFRCTIVVPGQVLPVTFMGTEYVVPYPSLVFAFTVCDGRVISSQCFALKDKYPKDSSMLCYYPFGNVYDTGNICWGSNNLPEVKEMCELDRLVSLFLGSPTNMDLYTPEKQFIDPPEYTTSLRSFYEELKNKEAFPTEILLENGKLLGSL